MDQSVSKRVELKRLLGGVAVKGELQGEGLWVFHWVLRGVMKDEQIVKNEMGLGFVDWSTSLHD